MYIVGAMYGTPSMDICSDVCGHIHTHIYIYIYILWVPCMVLPKWTYVLIYMHVYTYLYICIVVAMYGTRKMDRTSRT